MLHVFLEDGPWFRAKSHGYGAGLPIKWQGWMLLAVHMAVIAGVAAALRNQPVAMTLAAIAVAVAPFPIYHARTEGGWRWRWGSRD